MKNGERRDLCLVTGAPIPVVRRYQVFKPRVSQRSNLYQRRFTQIGEVEHLAQQEARPNLNRRNLIDVPLKVEVPIDTHANLIEVPIARTVLFPLNNEPFINAAGETEPQQRINASLSDESDSRIKLSEGTCKYF
jgi:hypothetical protein